MPGTAKDPGAFRTIGEVSDTLGVAQHILRYWEEKFPQLSPVKRAGNRRYYRPADIDVARRIDRLLNHEGYTMKGAQRAMKTRAAAPEPVSAPATLDRARLRRLRDRLQGALDA